MALHRCKRLGQNGVCDHGGTLDLRRLCKADFDEWGITLVGSRAERVQHNLTELTMSGMHRPSVSIRIRAQGLRSVRAIVCWTELLTFLVTAKVFRRRYLLSSERPSRWWGRRGLVKAVFLMHIQTLESADVSSRMVRLYRETLGLWKRSRVGTESHCYRATVNLPIMREWITFLGRDQDHRVEER